MDTITHDKTPDTHSAIVGGSSASRILGCPGSVDLLAKLPDSVRNASSSYADEGTGLHEIMAYLVDNDIPLDAIMTDERTSEIWGKYDLHMDRMYDAVVPAYTAFLAYCDKLLEGEPADAELLIRVESRVQMPGIDGAFGTCDVLIRAPRKTAVWDWKFGQGVPVLASYKLATGGDPLYPDQEQPQEYGNDQLMFYARAAMESYPDYFKLTAGEMWPVELVICQPRILDEELSTFETTHRDLEEFRLDLVDAVDEALSGKGKLAMGSYCRFAACKTICPLHFNAPAQMVDLGEKLGKLKMQQELGASLAAQPSDAQLQEQGAMLGIDYADALAAMLTIAEIVEPYLKEATAQAHTFMEAGGEVPGYKLVPKRAGWDGWEDPKKTDAFLGRQGLAVDERRKPWEPITPAVARKKIKALGDDKALKLLEKYVKPGLSSGTTLAPADDKREAVKGTAAMVGELAKKIASL